MPKCLDQSGISLCLAPAYSWTKKGRANRHEVRTRWGKQGRINLIGTLCLDEEVESLRYRMLWRGLAGRRGRCSAT